MSRRGAGGSSGPSREVQVSKKLSWLLRHGAEKEGLELGPGGYANVSDVVSPFGFNKFLLFTIHADFVPPPVVLGTMQDAATSSRRKTKYTPQLNCRTVRSLKVTFPEVQALVASNDKQRFSLKPISSESPSDTTTTNAASYLIRANQGHSIKVADDGLLSPLTASAAAGELPHIVVHGTTRRAWPLIVAAGGLKPMTRNHIHFATGLPSGFRPLDDGDGGDAAAATAADGTEAGAPVISGMRNSSTVLIFIDLAKALDTGLTFWKSENGVVLCDGGEHALLPLACFKRVEERDVGGGGGILLQDGVVVAELREKRTESYGRSRGKKGVGKEKPRLVVDNPEDNFP
jgi:2'-phosphotransferase